MKQRSATADRILDASRNLFNAKGYAATSVTEIAASLGISQGNLTYHFPTKRDLALALEDDILAIMREHRANQKRGSLAEDYIDHVTFGIELTWRFRFLMRDRIHYSDSPIGQRPDSELNTDFQGLVALLSRIRDADLFLRGQGEDLETLGRSLWIVSRFWIDYLRELEGLTQISWADQTRGIRQHLSILLPRLKASARHDFEAALEQRQQ
ncbi:TetR/AcrR family transcriptional regulator [Parasphingopyxis sp. CP4]|uniref:TetR/AcrR family transcriptional regulator n=1 Tax=Parasphingopyxis sp. CP4 TaxID=2724527 RepID=UPI0015A0169C|nr:TetR/AcrR family transcriptional regulator [Parasphingopyxis sp. CP4]